VAELSAGRLDPPAAAGLLIDGPVVVDSRAATPGALFVAVKGEHVDGYDFAAAAAAAGAAVALADRSAASLPTVVVADPVRALGLLAHGWLDRLSGLGVVAVTGSAGKTTTKDLLAHLLAEAGPTVAAPASYNNEIGVPLTVLSAGGGTRFLVLEMGARGLGHLADLTRIARPNVGVVLNVGAAHVGEFGSTERIAAAKAELVEALPADGVAVLNADDSLVAAMSARTSARVVTFGTTPVADVRAESIRLSGARARFTLACTHGSAEVALKLLGAHQVPNALAAAAVALDAGLPVAAVAAALGTAEPVSRWRMEVSERPDGVTVVNDAYNANPASTHAALQTLVAMAPGRRTWAVLGEMLELGDAAGPEHEAVGHLAADLGVDRLVAVGPGARPVLRGAERADRAGTIAVYAADVGEAVRLLADEVGPGDVVLVKASRGIGLDRIAAALLAGADP
jgi:UDP-N-acetylmuramoyl-tripeptide--D-alanyl-D-alanine ligase